MSRTWFSLSKKEHQPKVSLVSSSHLLWICPLCTLVCMTLPSDQQGLKSCLAWQNLFSSPTVNGPCCDNHCLQKTLEKGHTGPNNIHVGKRKRTRYKHGEHLLSVLLSQICSLSWVNVVCRNLLSSSSQISSPEKAPARAGKEQARQNQSWQGSKSKTHWKLQHPFSSLTAA